MINFFSKKFWKFWSMMAPAIVLLSTIFAFVWLLFNGIEYADDPDEQYYIVSKK